MEEKNIFLGNLFQPDLQVQAKRSISILHSFFPEPICILIGEYGLTIVDVTFTSSEGIICQVTEIITNQCEVDNLYSLEPRRFLASCKTKCRRFDLFLSDGNWHERYFDMSKYCKDQCAKGRPVYYCIVPPMHDLEFKYHQRSISFPTCMFHTQFFLKKT